MHAKHTPDLPISAAPDASADESSPQGRITHALRLLALGLLLIGCFAILRPFLSAILWAMVLSISLWPAYTRLNKMLRGRPTLAALLMLLAILLVLLTPFVIMGFSFADDVKSLMTGARRVMESPPQGPPAWLDDLPLVGSRARGAWEYLAADSARLLGGLRRLVEPVTAWLLGVSVALFSGLAELALSIVLTFFLLRNGDAIVQRLVGVGENLAGGSARRLLTLSEKTVRGVVYGILGTALAQSILAGIGFLIVGLPGPGFLALLTFLLSVTPVGPPMVWIPATLWLLHKGSIGSAIFMVCWGLLVSSVDNVVKPMIIGQAGRMPFILVLMGVLGGALAFGFIGIFLGPTLLALGLSLLHDWTQGQMAKNQSVGAEPALVQAPPVTPPVVVPAPTKKPPRRR